MKGLSCGSMRLQSVFYDLHKSGLMAGTKADVVSFWSVLLVMQIYTTRFLTQGCPIVIYFCRVYFVTAVMTKEGLIDEWSTTPLYSECEQECLSSVANHLPLYRLYVWWKSSSLTFVSLTSFYYYFGIFQILEMVSNYWQNFKCPCRGKPIIIFLGSEILYKGSMCLD